MEYLAIAAIVVVFIACILKLIINYRQTKSETDFWRDAAILLFEVIQKEAEKAHKKVSNKDDI